jgi:hypothetical protein
MPSELDEIQKHYDSLHSVAKLVGDLALSISEAQGRLDTEYMKNLRDFAQTFHALLKDSPAGAPTSEQYIGLFRAMAPSRYQFTETTIEVRADLQMAGSEELGAAGSLGITTGVFAVAVNASYAKRSAFDYRGSALIRTVLNAIPAEPGILDKLLDRGGKPPSVTMPDASRFKAIAELFKELPRLSEKNP